MIRRPPRSTLFPYTSSSDLRLERVQLEHAVPGAPAQPQVEIGVHASPLQRWHGIPRHGTDAVECNNRASRDRKSTRLNSSHLVISYAVFCLKKKKKTKHDTVRIGSGKGSTVAMWNRHGSGASS